MSRLLAVILTAVCATAQAAAPPDRVSLLLHEGRECRRAGRGLAAEPALMEARNLCLDGRAQTAEFARVEHELGLLYLEREKDRAEAYLGRAVGIFEKLYPQGHPELADCLSDLALAKDAHEADRLLGRSLDMTSDLMERAASPERLQSLRRQQQRDLGRFLTVDQSFRFFAYARVLRWKRQSPLDRADEPVPANVGVRLVKLLPAHAALIEFFASDARLFAFVLRPKMKDLSLVDLGPRPAVEEAVDEWNAAREKGDGRAARRAAERLRRLVWQPLEKHLKGCETILAAPAGRLRAFPLAVLPGDSSTYLIEERAIGYLPSGLKLLSFPAQEPEPRKLLAVGGISYGEGERWRDLPGTGRELDGIGRATGDRRCAELRGEKADKGALLKAWAAGSEDVFHLATHTCPRERRRSHGLVLAHANTRGDRSILTADEVATCDLRHCRLAVLSVCAAARPGGEDERTLLGAFHAAGVGTVVASLWDCGDHSSALLMEQFHLNLWRKKLSKLEALRQAQLYVLRNPKEVAAREGLRGRPGKKPVKLNPAPASAWAGYVLSGDWR